MEKWSYRDTEILQLLQILFVDIVISSTNVETTAANPHEDGGLENIIRIQNKAFIAASLQFLCGSSMNYAGRDDCTVSR